jgi:hypothetical protein
MNQRKHTPGRYAFFPSVQTPEMSKADTFYDKEAFAFSQLERSLDLRNSGIPVEGPETQERIKHNFFKSFLNFWIK